jgi:cytochrome c
MDGFELNKILGALLGVCTFAMALGLITEAVFYESDPEQPGYLIEVAEDPAGAAPVEEEVVPIAVLMASADAAAGESAARKCAACHSFEQGGANKVGPNLWNVVMGPMAHLDSFAYSSAMSERSAAGGIWDYEALNGYLENPRGWMPGTIMSFAGVRREGERADIIAYLRSLSDNPPPLPKQEEQAPAEETAVEGEAAPAPEGQAPAEAPVEGEAPADAMEEELQQGVAPDNAAPATGEAPIETAPADTSPQAPAETMPGEGQTSAPDGTPSEATVDGAVTTPEAPAAEAPVETLEEQAPIADEGAQPTVRDGVGVPAPAE